MVDGPQIVELADADPWQSSAFTVTDDDRVREVSLGYSVELDTSTSWELTSPVARAMPASFAMVE